MQVNTFLRLFNGAVSMYKLLPSKKMGKLRWMKSR